jgi:hypothetical protein
MAKRTHFIPNDFETFFNDPDWEKTLKNKVDYMNTYRFKDRSIHRDMDCTFLSGLVSYNLLGGKEHFDHIFNVLDSKNYKYSDKDLILPTTLGAHLSSAQADGIIHLFKLYEIKGIKLTKTENRKAINFYFCHLENQKLDKYKLESGLVGDKELMKINFNHICVINDFNEYNDLDVFSFVSKSEKAEEKKRCLESMSFLKEIMNSSSTSKKVLEKMLKDIPTNKKLVSKFINKNKLEISIFNELEYFQALKLKPKEIFSNEFVEIIELLEKKLGVEYIDRTGKSPKKIFDETSKESEYGFNNNLSIHYKDGSSVELNGKRKFK